MYNHITHISNLQQDAIIHKFNLYIYNKGLIGSSGNIYLDDNATCISLTIYNNINICNRCNVQSEDLSGTTYKFIVYL